MLFRRPSSLPISARVVELNPLRAKHFAAAVRMAATRGLFQSTARGATESLTGRPSGSWVWTAVSTDMIRLEGLGRSTDLSPPEWGHGRPDHVGDYLQRADEVVKA